MPSRISYYGLVLLILICGDLRSQTADIIYEQNVASTVTIYTDAGQGSGFFVSPNIIATNYHVISGAYEIKLKLPNSSNYYDCEVLSYDSEHDLALCRTSLNKRAVKFSRSPIRIGQQVYVIGSPIGVEATFSDGRVSNIFNEEGFFQMTAPISPGSSGGPVLNERGELIGITTATRTNGQSLHLAVPIKYLNDLMFSSGLANKQEKRSEAGLPKSGSQVSKPNYSYDNSDYVYEVFLARADNLALSLDYLTTIEGSTCLYFNYEPHENDKVAIKSGDVFIRDRKTGVEFPLKYNELRTDKRIVYPGSSSKFCLCSTKIPDELVNFDLIEKNGSGLFNMFDLQMKSFELSESDDYLNYIKKQLEGTIAFYSVSPCGEIKIKVDGKYVGSLTGYFSDASREYSCGIEAEAMLNLRLPAGNHNFEAECGGKVWTGRVTVVEDGCAMIKVPN
jgi:hypothetical protein